MSDSSLMEMSISLMLHGMGVVFVFLVVAIFLISAMSRIIQFYFQSQARPETIAPQAATPRRPASGVDPQTLKAIQAALDQHRHRKR